LVKGRRAFLFKDLGQGILLLDNIRLVPKQGQKKIFSDGRNAALNFIDTFGGFQLILTAV